MQAHPMTSVGDVSYYLGSWASKMEDNIWKNLIEIISDCHNNNPYKLQKNADSQIYSMMWEEQCGINFPVMYVASIYLYMYACKRKCDTFLFATRDCCHWVKIFKKLFPDANAHYFDCSRNMLEKGYKEHNQSYKKYVMSLIKTSVEKTIFVDIHGTCQRILTYFNKEFKKFPYCFLLSSSFRMYNQFPKVCRKAHKEGKLLNIVFDARGTPIEMLNFDTIGTLQNFNERGPIRDPPEYSISRLEAYHVCIQYLLQKTIPWETVLAANKTFELEICELGPLIQRIYRVIQDNKPFLNNYIKHPGKH